MATDPETQDIMDIQPDKDGKFPETVTWEQYIAIKENLTQKVATLQEQLKIAPNAEEHTRITKELDELKTKHQQTSEELKSIKDRSIQDKKEALKARGVPDTELADMSEKELDKVLKVVARVKPGPDLGGGGGASPLKGSPMDLAVRSYTK